MTTDPPGAVVEEMLHWCDRRIQKAAQNGALKCNSAHIVIAIVIVIVIAVAVAVAITIVAVVVAVAIDHHNQFAHHRPPRSRSLSSKRLQSRTRRSWRDCVKR